MIKNKTINKSLYDFPKVKGKFKREFDLSKLNWFKVGGSAEVLFLPKDLEDLQNLLSSLKRNIPVIVLGAGSNTLIRDGGLAGIVIKLGKPFSNIDFLNDNKIQVGAAFNCIKLSRLLAKNNLSGLEFFSGIPGTVGGSIAMNAGAFGHETSDFLDGIKVLDRKGKIKKIMKNELKMTYRYSSIPKDNIIYEAIFRCKAGEKNKILKKISVLQKRRNMSQPIKNSTGGSTFKNPKNRKAWELIKLSGCEDMKVGGARLSKLHSNFIINSGNCSSSDIENLGELIREKVKSNLGINLNWEIKIIGSKQKHIRYFNG